MYEVTTREMPERSLLCLKRNVDEQGAWAFGKEFIAILRERPLPKIEGRAGAFFCIYWGEVSADSDGPVEWCRPVPETQAHALAEHYPELTLRTEPAHREAFAALPLGPDGKAAAEHFQLAIESLQAWAQEQGIKDQRLHDRGAAGVSQPRAGRRAGRRGRAPGPPPGVNADSFGIRLAGVGGTGVVTGPMVSDPKRSFPDRAAVRAPITDRVRDGAILVDVRQIVLGLFGDDQFANVFLVGAGFQAGALPLPPDAIEEALRVNGVAVASIQAFRRGHQSLAELRAQLDAPAGPLSPGRGHENPSWWSWRHRRGAGAWR